MLHDSVTAAPNLGGVQCEQCINRSEYILVNKIRRLGHDAHYRGLDAEQDSRVLFFNSCAHSSIRRLTTKLGRGQAAKRADRRLEHLVKASYKVSSAAVRSV